MTGHVSKVALVRVIRAQTGMELDPAMRLADAIVTSPWFHDVVNAAESEWDASRRLDGHVIWAEGAAFDVSGVRLHQRTIAGEGYGFCQCGARSEQLPSARQRKQWHRSHKQQMRKEANR